MLFGMEAVSMELSGGVFKGPVRELRRRSGDSWVISRSLSCIISGSSVRFSGEIDGLAKLPVLREFNPSPLPFARFLPYL